MACRKLRQNCTGTVLLAQNFAALTAGALVVAFMLMAHPVQAAAPVLKTPGHAAGKIAAPPGTNPALPDVPAPGSPPGAAPKAKTKDDHGGQPDSGKVIQSIELPAKPALVLTSKATWEEGYKTIGAMAAALRKEAERLKLKTAGQPLVIYLENSDSDFRFDVLLPIASKLSGPHRLADGIRVGENPGGTALKFEHRGPYSKIEDTYEAITAYLDEKGLIAREFFIEEFLSDLSDPVDGKHAVNIYVFLR